MRKARVVASNPWTETTFSRPSILASSSSRAGSGLRIAGRTIFLAMGG